MAMPVIKGEKTPSERFPGAVTTYCIEAMMQDRKALQAGTSHFLGQNFAKACDIKFLDASGEEAEYAWTTSLGRVDAPHRRLIMTHGDDDGLVLPPRLAPTHVVILPVIHSEQARGGDGVLRAAARPSCGIQYDGRPLGVEVDARDMRGGEKTWAWIKKGVPIRLEIGPWTWPPARCSWDGAIGARRNAPAEPRAEFVAGVAALLDEIQETLLDRARARLQEHTMRIDSKEEFYRFFTPENPERPEIHGGFALPTGVAILRSRSRWATTWA